MHKVFARRMTALLLSLCMVAGMIDLSGFTAQAADDYIQYERLEITGGPYVYAGAEIEPTVEVYGLNLDVEVKAPDGSYDITYSPNSPNALLSNAGKPVNAGTYKVRAEDKNNKGNIASGSFEVERQELSGSYTIKAIDEVTIINDGVAQPEVKLLDLAGRETQLRGVMSAFEVTGVDYIYNFADNDKDGTATVTVTGCGNYKGDLTGSFTVKKLTSADLSFTFGSSVTANYDSGNPAIPRQEPRDVTCRGEDLTRDQDYRIEYGNHTKATTEAWVRIVGINDYDGLVSEKKNYTVVKRIGEEAEIAGYPESLRVRLKTPVADQPYKGGAPVTITEEDIVLYDPDSGEDRLTPGVDYEIDPTTYKFNSAATTATQKAQVTVKGKGRYREDMVIEFAIVAPQLSSCTIVIPDANCMYDGTSQFDKLDWTNAVTNNGIVYEKGKDYEVTQLGDGTSAGDQKVELYPLPNGRLQGGSVTKSYNIKKRPLTEEAGVTIQFVDQASVDNLVFDNKAKEPPVQVLFGSKVLTKDDYDVEYQANKDAGTASVIAKGKGNFSDSTKPLTFTIKPYTLTMDNAEVKGILPSYTYTGKDHQPSPNAVLKQPLNGKVALLKDTDFTVEYNNNHDVGTATVIVKGKNNFDGQIDTQFEITKCNLGDTASGVRINVKSPMYYTGDFITPEVEINNAGTAMVEGEDYTMEVVNNQNVGKATVTFRGIENYEGETTREFEIRPRNIQEGDLVVVDANDSANHNFTAMTPDDNHYPYTGSEIVKKLQVQFSKGEEVGLKTLEQGTKPEEKEEGDDCIITFQNNKAIGTAQVTVEGTGNYSGKVILKFTIKGDLSDWEQGADPFTKAKIKNEIVYTTQPAVVKEEDIEITFDGNPLKLGTDYEIASEDVDAGPAYAKVTGKGNYYGEISSLPFTIRPLNLSTDSLSDNKYVIENVKEEYVYTGGAICPEPKITHNGTLLEKGTDYDVEYKDNTDYGTATLIIKSVNSNPNYIENYEMNFEITKYNFEADYAKTEIDVQGIFDAVLDAVKAGEDDHAQLDDPAVNPDGVVMKELKVAYSPSNIDGTPTGELKILGLKTDYNVIYDQNTKPGTAIVKINGMGNFTGTITKEFRIRGDLSSENTKVEVQDWIYTPPKNGEITNTPKPTVTYTVTYSTGRTEELALEEGVDYVTEYDKHANATLGGDPAIVMIKPVLGTDDVVTGNYTGETQGTFQILQRDLSQTVGEGKDPLLEVTGLLEEGYEYNGSEIIPRLQVTCDGTELRWVIAGESGDDYDYTIFAENNVNVFEYAYPEGPDGPKGERVLPKVTVEAKKDESGAYTGNYTGKFDLEFKINPRILGEETLGTLPGKVEGIPEEKDYTNKPITFPLPGDDTRNAIDVTWGKIDEEGNQVVSRLEEHKDYTISYKDNTKIGEATVTITAVEESNYAGSYDKKFKIMASIEVVDDPDSFPVKYMKLDFDDDKSKHDVPYGIVDVYPDMGFEDYSGVLCGESNDPYILQEGIDFEIVKADNPNPDPVKGASKNNVNVAREDAEEADRPTVVIRGIGCYRGVIKRYYNIIPKDLAQDQGDITVVFLDAISSEEYENAFLYTGEAIEPKRIEVRNHGQLMTPNVDYVIAGYENNTEISTETKQACVIIEAATGEGASGNYINSKKAYFNIIPRSIDGMQLTITDGPQIFDRTEKKPEVEVSFMEGTTKIVLSKDDYDVEYKNNINAASESAGEEAPEIIVTGKGAYSGTITRKFTIERESLEPQEETDDFDITATDAVYTGEKVTTVIEVKAKDGTLLVEGSDYEIGNYADDVEIGTGTVEIHGLGNYTGTRQIPFRILPPAGKIRIAEIEDQIYTSLPVTPSVEAVLVVDDMEGVEMPMKQGQDYELSYENNIDAGTATVKVTGIGNFSDIEPATTTFTIHSKGISVSGDDGTAADMQLEDIEDQMYTGNGVTPDVKLAIHRDLPPAEGEQENGDREEWQYLILGKDYELSYETNVAVGLAVVTITGIGNYHGTIYSSFRILGPMNLADVPKIPVQQFTGTEIRPEVKVSFAGEELTEGVDYTLEYKDNIERGTATIVVTGMGWYTGTKNVTFDIAREFSEETSIKGVAAAYTYTGAAIQPVIRVEDSGVVLSNGKDYKVSYKDNINTGKASITITGIDKYQGSKTVTFKITSQNLGRASVTKIKDQVYDGKEKKPSVSVISGGAKLKEGIDYKVAYDKNKAPGMANVTIRGMGNYAGAITTKFKITVPKVTGVKVSKYKDTSITFSWKRNQVVSGYQIYNAKNKRVAFVKKNKTTKATVSKLKAATSGTFRVRAYVVKSGVYYYSSFVKIKACTAPKATSITKLASKKSKQAVINWKKIKGASSYEVYRSTSKKGKYKKIASTKKTSYTDKKATGGKTYYYKIRVCKKANNKNYYSSDSAVMSVKAVK